MTLHDVRLARPEDADQVGEVCAAGFRASSHGLLPPASIELQVRTYYEPSRIRREIEEAHVSPEWQGYVVALGDGGRVIGAAGGGVRGGTRGQVLVLYLRPDLRGRGIGTTLLDVVTDQQRALGASEQWVSVTEGNDLAVPFYLARGFVEQDRVPFVDGAWSLRMRRELRATARS